jgi:protease-4
MDPRFSQLVQASIDHIYRNFTTLVATARKSTPEKIGEVAQGRVWVGRQALTHGLVDRLGSYGDALKAAATRAKLPEGYRVSYVEAQPGRLARLMQGFGLTLGDVSGAPLELQGALVALGLAAPLATGVVQDLGWLADVADKRQPFAAVTHCLCTVP